MAVPPVTCSSSCTPTYYVDKTPVSRVTKIAYEILEGLSTVTFMASLAATLVVSYSYAWGILIAFTISEIAKRTVQLSTPPVCPHHIPAHIKA